ncbi:hydroxymethylglutaryl-CoA lyase [Variovorax sp. RA8]|uniref:hydroxymethylglutaryl-CoA lyase n=1 Tax=Variovorax sp. (strain JCM 16519 / RA8) TaxID=662548 RepID=UPI000ACB6861|nr:hydroxymethylglutaryl-CoA lyase [Variovorax sp. RA8]VTU41986.1 Hydroxymethylglutaryl-CoA lyase YngG [Variovorax sp. RA8]
MPDEGHKQVRLREVGLRDGLQGIPQILPTAAKLAWIDAEFAAGVREIEVCSFVPAKLMPQFADAADVVRHALAVEGLTVAVLVPNVRGAESALELGVHKLNYVTSASERHNRANVRRSREESLEGFRQVARLAEGTTTTLVGGVSTAFGCTIEGPVAHRQVMDLVQRYIDAGAREIVLGDTVGYANPSAIRELVDRVLGAAAGLPVALHLHDTRGLGLANVVAGLQAGIRDFDSALGGMGGCPHAPGASGNIVSEDLAFLLESMGWNSGIDIRKLVQVRDILKKELHEVELLGAIAKAGLPIGFAVADA